MDEVDGVRPPTVYAFEANSWPDCIGPPVLLKHVFRQKDRSMLSVNPLLAILITYCQDLLTYSMR